MESGALACLFDRAAKIADLSVSGRELSELASDDLTGIVRIGRAVLRRDASENPRPNVGLVNAASRHKSVRRLDRDELSRASPPCTQNVAALKPPPRRGPWSLSCQGDARRGRTTK